MPYPQQRPTGIMAIDQTTVAVTADRRLVTDHFCCLGHLGTLGGLCKPTPAGVVLHPLGTQENGTPGYFCPIRIHSQTGYDVVGKLGQASKHRYMGRGSLFDGKRNTNRWANVVVLLLYGAMFWRVIPFLVTRLLVRIIICGKVCLFCWRRMSPKQWLWICIIVLLICTHTHGPRLRRRNVFR